MIKKIIIFYSTILFLTINALFPSSIEFKKKSSALKVCAGANFILDCPISSKNGRIIKESGGSISGNTITFEYGVIEDEGNQVNLSGKLDVTDQNKIILNGGKTFHGERGTVLQSIVISGTGNKVEGSFLTSGDIELQDEGSQAGFNLLSRLNGNINLHGGTIILDEDLRFCDNKRIIGPGVVEFNHNELQFGMRPLTWTDPVTFNCAMHVKLNGEVFLQSTWTFSGMSLVDGKNNLLWLDSGGKMIVERGSSLLLKNIQIKKINQGDFFCLDNLGTITFQNVKWHLDSDFTFSRGWFNVLGDLQVTGTHKFIYQSSRQSKIWSSSSLILDNGVTFSYDPLVARNDLIDFENETSILFLDNATLHSTVTGLQLTKGTMVVKGNNNYLSSEIQTDKYGGVLVDNGITFGNNSSQEDFSCQILSGAKLQVSQGSLNYKNTQPDLCKMENDSSVLQFDLNSKIKLHQTLDGGSGKIKFSSGPQIWYKPGKHLLGRVESSGYVFYRPL